MEVGAGGPCKKFFNSSVRMSPSTLMSAKIGKGGLRVEAGCEQQRSCSSVLDEVRMRQLAKVSEWQQHNLVAGSKDVRHQQLANKGALRAYLLDKDIPIPAESHESVNTRLHSLGYWQHDTPIVRRTFTSTGIKVTGSVPPKEYASCDLEQCKCQWQARRLGRQKSS